MTTLIKCLVGSDRTPRSTIDATRRHLSRAAMCLALFSCLIAANPATGQIPKLPLNINGNPLKTELDEKIDKHCKKYRLPGMAVVYARDGLLTYQRTKGYADVANKIEMTVNHVGRLNSVSKWIAGIVSMQQVEKGNINLNAPVKAYLPELPDHHTYDVIDLLSCRSGIRYYGDETSPLTPSDFDNDHYDTATEVIPLIMHNPLASEPGDYYYSTEGYTELAACLEQGANKSISDIIRTDLNERFGLKTLKAEDITESNSKRMKLYEWKSRFDRDGYGLGRNVEVGRTDQSWKVLGGGVESSPMDLLRLGILLCDGKIISTQNVEKMMTRITSDQEYALGCKDEIKNGYHVMTKSGSWKGSSSFIWLIPEERMVMVLMTNRKDSKVSSLGMDLLSSILKYRGSEDSGPDLVAKEFVRTGNTSYKNGKWEIPVRFKVANDGTTGANNSFVNGIKYDDKYRWTGFMDSLPPHGKSHTSTGIVRIPDNVKRLAGRTIELVAFADAPIAAADTSIPAYGRIDELEDVSNNQLTLKVKLPGTNFGLAGKEPDEPVLPSSPSPKPPVNQPPRRVQIAVPGDALLPPSRPSTSPRVPVVVPEATFVPPSRPKSPPKRVPVAAPQATFVPPRQTATPTRRFPSVSLPGRPARNSVLPKCDLEIRSIRFVPNQPKMVFVVVENSGQGPAAASVLRLTVRKIGNSAVARTKDVNVPVLAAGATKVLTVDATSILPNAVALKSTTFRVDADATKVVTESDETNNLEWHMP